MATQTNLDPSQKEYEHDFDFDERERELQQINSNAPDHPAERSRMDQADAWSRDTRGTAEREAAPSWATNIGNDSASQGGDNQGKGRFNITNMLKKRATQWAIGGLISLVIGISAAVPAVLSGAFVHMKELASNWAHKNSTSLFAKRGAIDLKKKLFSADPNCTDTGIKCEFAGGVTDDEIQKFKDAGLNPDVGQNGDKKFIKSFNTTDAEGKKVKITVDNFEDHYNTNIVFRGQMDSLAKPSSLLLRGLNTVRFVLDKFGVLRNRAIKGATPKDQNAEIRQDIYSDGNPDEKVLNPPGTTDPNSQGKVQAIQGVDSNIQQLAQQQRDQLAQSNFTEPPSIVPDTTSLDLNPDQAIGVAGKAIQDGAKSGVKGLLLGLGTAIDSGCTIYGVLRAVDFGAKIYKVIGLIKYAGLFLTIADKLKAGDAAPLEVAALAAILFKASTAKNSYGKTFFQSEGFNLIFQGKIGDHRGLARFTTGSAFLQFIQRAKQVAQDVGANKTTCKIEKSWFGQAALLIVGLGTSILTDGAGALVGLANGVLLGMLISVLMSYAVPLLIQYAAGTVAPDPTDAEGGYGAGNAIAAGIGALGTFTGEANGARVLTTADATAVEMSSNKEMAFENQVDNYGKSPFSLSSSTSITSQLAIAAAPVLTSPFSQGTMQTLASVITSPFSMFSNSFSNLVTQGVNAQSDINRDGQYCADDEYIQMNLAVDAFCNPIVGQTDKIIHDQAYEPGEVINYMLNNNYVNPDGTPNGGDFQKYINSCVDRNAPISPDGGGIDVGEDVDTRWCVSTDKEFVMFDTFVTDQSILSDFDASMKGTLGQDTSSGGIGTTTPTPTNGTPLDAAQCKTTTDSGQRVGCNAAIFEPYFYSWGGGHGSLDSLKQTINDALNGVNKGAAVLDCSGLARAAYYMTYGVDIGAGNADSQVHSKFFKPVAKDQAKPGDVIWHSTPDHIEIITANHPSSQTWSTIEASEPGRPIIQSTASYSDFESFTYTGAK